MNKNKERYRELCEQEKSIHLFSRYEWLNTLLPPSWDVVLSTQGDNIVGAMPYFIKTKAGFKASTMHRLTPYLGIWFNYPPDQKYAKKLAFEKKVMDDIIEQLPKVDYFVQHFPTSFTNWMPFYWKSFEQTTRYTYIINDLTDKDKIFSEFRDNIRREIRKAEKTITVSESDDAKALHELNTLASTIRSGSDPFTFEQIKGMCEFGLTNDCGKLWFAKNENGELVSALYLVWDELSAYYVIGCTDPKHKNSGAMSLLMWHAIQHAATVTQQFNFEGSMIEPVERFFRAFGATQTPYFRISKTYNKLLKLKDMIR